MGTRRNLRDLLGDTVGYSEGYWADGTEKRSTRPNTISTTTSPASLHIEPGHKWSRSLRLGYLPAPAGPRLWRPRHLLQPDPRQNEYMRQRFARHGRRRRHPHRREGPSDIKQEPNTYDRYVSIGVYEHAGRSNYREWLDRSRDAQAELSRRDLDDGQDAPRDDRLPTLKIRVPRRQRPEPAAHARAMRDRGPDHAGCRKPLAAHARTAHCWLERLERDWPNIQRSTPRSSTNGSAHLDDVPVRHLEHVPRQSELVHIVFMKGRDEKAYPWNRDYMYRDWRVRAKRDRFPQVAAPGQWTRCCPWRLIHDDKNAGHVVMTVAAEVIASEGEAAGLSGVKVMVVLTHARWSPGHGSPGG